MTYTEQRKRDETQNFSDQKFFVEEILPATLKYVPILSPFWGELPEDQHFKARRFQSLVENGQSFLEMTSLEECDVAIFFCHWQLIVSDEKAYNLALQFIEKAKSKGKPVGIFSQGDWISDQPMESAIIFYTSSFQSKRRQNEFAMPEWTSNSSKDFGSQISIRKKQEKPRVGFYGYAPPLGMPFGLQKLKSIVRLSADNLGLMRRFCHKTGHTNRVIAVSNLSKSPLVETNFVPRKNFAFSSKSLQSASLEPEKLAQRLQQEFCQNIIDSDYIVCCNGYENYSIRLYETLSFGRIPIFINTDCVLPYDFAIDWKKYCVWVDESELPFIADKVADFHNALAPQEFEDLQYECRRMWEEWLSPEGFFDNFYRHLEM